MFLILIETSGNQKYIFETNKLRENLGASQLLHQACTDWLECVIKQVQKNTGATIGKIITTSGKALLTSKTETAAQEIIRHITHKVLTSNSGIEISGVYQEFDWEGEAIGQINRQLHERLNQFRGHNPGIADRALRLPIIAECATSGLPAATVADYDSTQPISQRALAKSSARDKAFERIQGLLPQEVSFARNADELENCLDQLDRIAIIHADGNGLGEIFLNFEQYIADESSADIAASNKTYCDKLEKFSQAIDLATQQAFKQSLKQLKPSEGAKLPLIPLILGGDDLTVICHAQDALTFTVEFLKAFETASKNIRILQDIANRAFGKPYLSACAGVAIVKPKFPFHTAYDLAEALLRSAKQVKQIVQWHDNRKPLYPCSAIDFHVLYDSSSIDLQTIRDRLTVTEQQQGEQQQTQLFNKPYLVSTIPEDDAVTNRTWIKQHHWEVFKTRCQAFQSVSPDEASGFPSSQSHQLRQTLFSGAAAADAHFNLLLTRYPQIKKLGNKSDNAKSHISLFNRSIDGQPPGTSYLDALEAADFLHNPTSTSAIEPEHQAAPLEAK